jgi:DNA-binding transcriptional LysR family regulator
MTALVTLEQLRVFVAVAEHLHVTNAAYQLNMTQSAASASIAALENRCAVRLFNRVGRRIELTDEGARFLVEAKAVLQRASEAELVLDDLSNFRRGTLTIHAGQTIANYWLPAVLHRFRKVYPDIKTEVRIGNTAQVVSAVLDGEAHIGMIAGDVDNASIDKWPVDTDRLLLVVGAGHPAARDVNFTVERFMTTPWIVREPGSSMRRDFEILLTGFGVDPAKVEIALELPSNEAVRQAVIENAGASIISNLLVDKEIRGGSLRQLNLSLPQRPFLVLQHRERYRSRTVDALIDIIKTINPSVSGRDHKTAPSATK